MRSIISCKLRLGFLLALLFNCASAAADESLQGDYVASPGSRGRAPTMQVLCAGGTCSYRIQPAIARWGEYRAELTSAPEILEAAQRTVSRTLAEPADPRSQSALQKFALAPVFDQCWHGTPSSVGSERWFVCRSPGEENALYFFGLRNTPSERCWDLCVGTKYTKVN
jgi:hypothetical protein